MSTNTALCVICRGVIGPDLAEDTQYMDEEGLTVENIHICVNCGRKERISKLVKEFTPFMEKFSKMVNSCSFDHSGLVTEAIVHLFFREHRYLQNEMVKGLLKIMTKIGEQSGNSMYEDGRNQWGLKFCKEVSKLEVTL